MVGSLVCPGDRSDGVLVFFLFHLWPLPDGYSGETCKPGPNLVVAVGNMGTALVPVGEGREVAVGF